MQMQLSKLRAENEQLKRELQQIKTNPSALPQTTKNFEAHKSQNSRKQQTQPKQTPVKTAAVTSNTTDIPPPPPPDDELSDDENTSTSNAHTNLGVLGIIEQNRAALQEAGRSSGKRQTKISVLEGRTMKLGKIVLKNLHTKIQLQVL